jgi:23S rRNA pseudouridine2604 synthase
MKQAGKVEQDPAGGEESISLNKYISDSGFCSRRAADELIAQGRVTINGRKAATGNRVNAGGEVEIDGEPIRHKSKTIYLMLNKPPGVTSTTDVQDKTNIVSFLNLKQRIFPVGRLDKDSEGLIILTNDGNIVNKILRAGNRHEKEYIVTVDKPLTPEFITAMSSGVNIMGTRTNPCKVNAEGKTAFRIVLEQGLNRQIRRMCDALDYKVKRLIRIRIMNLKLGTLSQGSWRYLTPEELKGMLQMIAESNPLPEKKARKEYIPDRKKAGVPEKSVGSKSKDVIHPNPVLKKKATSEKKEPDAPAKKSVKKRGFKEYRKGKGKD